MTAKRRSCAILLTGMQEKVHSETYIDLTIPAFRRGKDRKTMFASIARRYQAWRQYEAVRRELSHLTDRELADIGITRCDIERIASDDDAHR